MSPITLVGKLIYRDTCDMKFAWDRILSGDIAKRWSNWLKRLPACVTVPRTLTPHREPIKKIDPARVFRC